MPKWIASIMDKHAKIYVAGHRGLVGSALCRALEQNGYTNLLLRSHAELDLLDGSAVAAFFASERPEYVFLAAAFVGGIMANNTYRADFIYNNLQIQQHVIGESFRTGVKKLLFLGSTCIYPRDAEQPIREEALLTSPLEYSNEPYAIAKIAGLKLCESFNLQYGCNFLAVMPTNLYGPRDNFDLERSHVLPAMIRKLSLAKALNEGDWDFIRRDLARRPLPALDAQSAEPQILTALAHYGIEQDMLSLWGTGKPLREFMWSEDMAAACLYIMERVDFEDLLHAGQDRDARNFHINIGTGSEISIRDLAGLIAELLEYRGEIRFDSSKPDGTMRKLTDPSKLWALGWRHRVELPEGLSRLVDWYHRDLDAFATGWAD